jgi:hypothetical protein
VCLESKVSRKERRFCSMVAEVCAWILARQKVIDRPISRAERMALVLRITRFIGMPMKPTWHARCHPSRGAGLCIFSTGMQRLSVLTLISAKHNILFASSTDTLRLRICKHALGTISPATRVCTISHFRLTTMALVGLRPLASCWVCSGVEL